MITTMRIDEAFTDVTSKGHKIPQANFRTTGKYAVIDQGEKFIAGYISDASLVWKEELPVILFGDHTRAIKYVDFPFVSGADGVKILRPNSGIHCKYAYYNLIALDIPSAGYSRHYKFLKELHVIIPEFDEQKRIALLLDKADRLRHIRRYTQQLSATFLQAVFIKMFGDMLLCNSTIPMIELVNISGGGTPSRDVPRYFRGNIPWITPKDMRSLYIADSQEHVTEEAICNSATKLVPADSILIVVKSKVLMHRLPISITRKPVCHNQDIKSVQCSDKIQPLFLLSVIQFHENSLLRQARGANTEGLTLPMLEEIKVPDVAPQQRAKFAEIARRVERLRTQQREATRQAEHLFNKLLHDAFTYDAERGNIGA